MRSTKRKLLYLFRNFLTNLNFFVLQKKKLYFTEHKQPNNKTYVVRPLFIRDLFFLFESYLSVRI